MKAQSLADKLEANLKRQLAEDEETARELRELQTEHIYQEKQDQDRQEAEEMAEFNYPTPSDYQDYLDNYRS